MDNINVTPGLACPRCEKPFEQGAVIVYVLLTKDTLKPVHATCAIPKNLFRRLFDAVVA